MHLAANARHLLWWCVGVVVVINLVSLGLRLMALDQGVSALAADDPDAADVPGIAVVLRHFNVEAEANVPTWVNGSLLLMAALACWGAAVTARRTGAPNSRHWSVLALVFGYLSLDEMSRLHERTIPYVARVVEAEGFLTFGWVLIAGPVTLIFALSYLGFLRRLPDRTRNLIVIAGVIFVGGAIGVEMVSAQFFDERGTIDSLPYVLATNIEELFEMLGVALFLYAVTDYDARVRSSRTSAAPDNPSGTVRRE